MNTFQDKVYSPKPFFKNKLFRYFIFHFPKDTKNKPNLAVEMVESTGKSGRARIYKGAKFRMNLSQKEVASLINRIEYILYNYHFFYSEKKFMLLSVASKVTFEHFPPAKNGVKNKTLFSFGLLDREAIMSSLKEKNESEVAVARISMGKKGVSFSINLTRDELARLKEDFKILYSLLFSIDTGGDYQKKEAGKDNEELAKKENFDWE